MSCPRIAGISQVQQRFPNPGSMVPNISRITIEANLNLCYLTEDAYLDSKMIADEV
jgi:hypothetical protein